jgi:hypothetical protein
MNEERKLSTADFAAAADRREQPQARGSEQREEHGMGRETRGELRDTAREPRDGRPDERLAPAAERVMPQPPEQDEDARAVWGGAGKQPGEAAEPGPGEQLAPLFQPQTAQGFRSQWDEVQIGFVDDPVSAVRRADELVAQVMKNLAQTFAQERSHLEGEMNEGDTEHMRMALRRYRSFFQRLLSL